MCKCLRRIQSLRYPIKKTKSACNLTSAKESTHVKKQSLIHLGRIIPMYFDVNILSHLSSIYHRLLLSSNQISDNIDIRVVNRYYANNDLQYTQTCNCIPYNLTSVNTQINSHCSLQWRIQRGAEGTFAPPPPPKIGKKKSVLISPFPHIWWLKIQNFLGSLRSPSLFNIILNIALLKNLENNICSYILSSFYMVAIGEGNFDMKMQDF